MAIAKSLSGARAVLILDGKTIGTAQNVSVNIGFQVDPLFTIGRFEAAELVPNSQQPATITMRMVRIIGVSPLQKLRLPTLNDVAPDGLLMNQDFTIQIVDRQNSLNPTPGQGVTVMQVTNCRTTGFSLDTPASQTSEMTLTFTGIYIGDEGLSTTDNQDADTPAFDVL